MVLHVHRKARFLVFSCAVY